MNFYTGIQEGQPRKMGMLGRLPMHSEETHPRLKLANYIDESALPTTPASVDWCSKVSNWPMYYNDQLGDCTCAAVGHQLQGWTQYASAQVAVPDESILKLYESQGYVPGDQSTDQGAVIQDVLQEMTNTGIPDATGNVHKYELFAQLNIKNMKQVYQALYMFGSVYLGINVPGSAEDQFNNHQPWTNVGDTNILGGHAIVVQAKDSKNNLNIITWGTTQEMEQSFWNAYVEEAWVVLTPDWFSSTGTTPDGLNLDQMKSDFSGLYN